MNAIDIANQIAQASAPLVAPVFNPAIVVAEAAASGIVVNGAEPTPAAPAPVVKPVLTRAESLALQIKNTEASIELATKRLEVLTAQLDSVDKLASIVVGSTVSVQLGRAETTRTVDGTVQGIKTEDSGARKFKLLVGEGFDATVEVVNETQILSVK